MNTLKDFFLTTVERVPNNLFLSNGHRSFTYERALAASCSRAYILLEAGASPGDRVVIVDSDPLETSLWLLACSLVGIIFLVLHEKVSERRIAAIVRDIDPVGVIDTRTTYKEVNRTKAGLRFLISDAPQEDLAFPKHVPVVPDRLGTDPAFLVCTSGSTKEPRAVICPHRSVLAVSSSINGYLHNSSQDRIGHLLSLSFVYGLYQIFLAIEAGATIIFLEKFRSPTELIAQLQTHRITGFPALRLILSYLVRLEPATAQVETLRYITCAGECLPVPLVNGILSLFSRTPFFYMYGQSECSRALYMAPERLAHKPASVGRAIPGTRAFLVNEAGEMASTGEMGELIVEGPHIMSGYWNAPEETSAKFFWGPHGQPRLRTGDLFIQDNEGDFYFVSRKDDLIKSRGFRINPREVEALILQADPAVEDCLVYGAEDNILGQAICAQVVVSASSHTASTILMRCRATMEPHLVPATIQVVSALPTTPSGKYCRPRSVSALPHENLPHRSSQPSSLLSFGGCATGG